MDYQSCSIRQLLGSVISGNIRIPAFQRAFVWEMDRVAYLMDSIYKGYPFGSILFWRTKSKLSVERMLGQFQLPNPTEDYPIDYVLDGQQRVTSIFSVFQTELEPTVDNGWLSIYFDLDANEDVQQSQFLALDTSLVISDRHFPLNVLFDSVKYREATDNFTTSQIKRIDKLQEKFKEVSIPIQFLKTDDRTIVGIVFERINRLGMPLDTLQLLTAWTWNEDFDLLKSFRELKEELEEFGFSEVGEDSDLILKCTAAIMKAAPTPESLLELNGQEIRAAFPKVRNGIMGAIDFMRKQLKITALKNLPYSTLIIPLTVFFAEPDGKEVCYDSKVYNRLKKWFWRSCFTGRYSNQVKATTIDDIKEISKLKNGEASNLGEITCNIKPEFFLENCFKLNNSTTKTFVLALANNNPKTFLSGSSIDLDRVLQKYNKTEFHHIYPKAYLQKKSFSNELINCLANFCFINASENKKISSKKPSDYVCLMPADKNIFKDILISAFCPEDTFNDNFTDFYKKRAELLTVYVKKLIQSSSID